MRSDPAGDCTDAWESVCAPEVELTRPAPGAGGERTHGLDHGLLGPTPPGHVRPRGLAWRRAVPPTRPLRSCRSTRHSATGGSLRGQLGRWRCSKPGPGGYVPQQLPARVSSTHYISKVSFSVGADEYDRFMGRYSGPLARRFAGFAGIEPGQRALDVGCGPGALTGELVNRLKADAVWAIDPSEGFVDAVRTRYPGVQVQSAAAEELPFEDRWFDVTLAQLVVHFMDDPVLGLREMARVTRASGAIAACVWDHAGGHGPLSLFWAAARELDPEVQDESRLAGTRSGHLEELFHAAGLSEIEETGLSVDVEHPSFEEWWEPFTFGVGPPGTYVLQLDSRRTDRLRDLCREMLPAAPFDVSARAWSARGVV